MPSTAPNSYDCTQNAWCWDSQFTCASCCHTGVGTNGQSCWSDPISWEACCVVVVPTSEPSPTPSISPTGEPTSSIPSIVPSAKPTDDPTSSMPSLTPSISPTVNCRTLDTTELQVECLQSQIETTQASIDSLQVTVSDLEADTEAHCDLEYSEIETILETECA